MPARGTELVDRIIQELERISPANGFHTDAGSRVTRGRPESLELQQAGLPLISVSTSASDPVTAKPRAVIKAREVLVTGLVDANERDYEPDLDELDEDITMALLALMGMYALPSTTEITITGGDYIHPEGGSNTAGITHTITISYALKKNEG
ncbi:hypothetical protein [Marinobacter sp. CA1]|uniref:hypothetical protein n=1 Tax=Marinobacter sp. CA1 TaxID=2817656 RepID=UPI001D079B08|nr:hypothetical protein [Marinobacter sp. CA1]UDL03974.1 hypothetical protein J2887_14795 [Marinobacter sp. CA1]